jgi:ABC-type glycerol-3-phosphate transport system substrate-binding protein
MVRRFGLVLGTALMLAGCGGNAAKPPAPQFKDDAEELRYLKSLSSPTVEQFRRKEDLESQAIDVDRLIKEAREERAMKKAAGD